MYSGDDFSYMAHATSLAFGQFPSYGNEYYQGSESMKQPFHSIGAGLMAAPFVFTFSLIDRWQGHAIVSKRTKDNMAGSWTVFGFVWASCFYFCLSLFLLYQALILFFKKNIVVFSVIIMSLCQGIPLFVFRRPVFTHTYEFFLQSFLVYIFLKLSYKEHRYNNILSACTIGLILGLVVLVRLNNIFVAFIWPLVLFYKKGSSFSHIFRCIKWKSLCMTYFVCALIVFIFQILPDIYYNNRGNDSVIKGLLLDFEPISFYIQRSLHILFGPDWGLIYSAPFILIGLCSLMILKSSFKNKLILLSLPLLVNFYILMAWKTQGGWYGYRYFIASAIPVMIIPITHFIQCAHNKIGRWIYWILSIIAVVPFLSMLCFEGGQGFFVTVVKQYFGTEGYGNNMYQYNIWNALLSMPQKISFAVSQGGVFYGQYLLALLKGNFNQLPFYIRMRYPIFDQMVLIKTLIIYTCPMLVFSLAQLKNKLFVKD